MKIARILGNLCGMASLFGITAAVLKISCYLFDEHYSWKVVIFYFITTRLISIGAGRAEKILQEEQGKTENNA